MDLATQRKLVRLLWGVCPHDEYLMFFWERQRELSWSRPAFISAAMRVSNESFLAELNDKRRLDKSFRHVISRVSILPESCQHLRRNRFCSIKDFFNQNLYTFLSSIMDLAEYRRFIQSLALSQPEPYESPPKSFTPVPGVEVGGCARNDSLPALAIN